MAVPTWLEHFVDDAAIFPPAGTALEQAVADHRAHRQAEYADLVGGFVVSDTKIGDLVALVGAPVEEGASPPVEEGAQRPSRNRAPLAVNLVVTGGAGAIEPAVTWVGRSDGLTLRAVEFALRDEDDLAHNARRLVQVLDGLGDALGDATVFAEPPVPQTAPSHGWLAALDELAAREVSLKLRTGGVTEDAFPSAAQLATIIDAALDRELPFKCTAGLHNAVRHRDLGTGFEHHGFLNVLLATRTALDGAGPDEVARVLDDPRGLVLAEQIYRDTDMAARTRRWFTSFGSCAVREAHEDLVELGLL